MNEKIMKWENIYWMNELLNYKNIGKMDRIVHKWWWIHKLIGSEWQINELTTMIKKNE